MKDITLEGFYRTEDEGIPAFVYDVELHDGQDFKGKFNVQFAAVETQRREAAFAVVVQGFAPFTRPWTDATRALVDDLIEHGEFYACINYENRDWVEPSGGYATVLMGRDLGEDFDVTQRLQLGAEDIEALREIRSVLNEQAD